MMYNVKSSHTPSKKHQEKNFHNVKHSVTSKITDKNDNIDKMVLKNFKPKMNSESAFAPDKIKDSKLLEHSNFLTNQVQHSDISDKHSDKRKEEKICHGAKKKLKADNSVQISELSSESLLQKKPNKFKSMFPKTYICKYCCRRYHSVEQLRQHTNAEHANKPSHICHLCSHQAASFSALMTHYLKHSGNKRDNVEKIYAKSKADFSNIQFNMFSRPKCNSSIQCNKCSLNFSSKAKYDAHNCSNIPQKSEYNCAYCRHVSTTVEDYRNHIQSHSETPFTCSYCKHKAMTKKQFDSHRESCKMRLKSNVNYKCEKCNVFSTKSKKEFNSHFKKCGETEKMSHTCAKCKTEFKEKRAYEEHLLVCNKSNSQNSTKNNNDQKSTKKTFRRKRKVKESVTEKNKLLCCVCDHLCSSKSEHEEHERQCLAAMADNSDSASNKITTIASSVCSDSIDVNKFAEHSKNDVSLDDKHLKDDHNARRSRRLVRRKSSFTDDEIIKKPKSLKIKLPKKPKIPKLLIKPKFRKGRQSKNANNPFLCNYCDFTFCSKSTLLRHKRMHSGNPWYVCQYCGKFFFRKDVYIRHEMNVHKNSPKNVFCCYYCKLCFNETVALKEHVEAIHKKSAFLPIKHNMSDKDDDESPVKRKIVIKQERDHDAADMAKSSVSGEMKTDPSPNSNSYIESNSPNYSKFKCSECFEFFENASSIEIHMQTHAKFSLDSKTNKAFELNKDHDTQKHIHANEIVSFSQKMSTVNKLNQIEEHLGDTSNLSKVLSEKNLDNSSDPYAEIDETSRYKSPDIGELNCDTNASTSELSQSLNCKLCLKCFSNKKLLDEHNNVEHKIVDWYQCLVCSSCGPKREMLEHMLTHMYKVGSFVIGNTEDYDDIISSLQNDSQKETHEKDPDVSDDKQNTDLSNANLVSEDELPPLKEYGLCSCFDRETIQKMEKCKNLSVSNCNDVELKQNKEEEAVKCFEVISDFSEKQEDRKISLAECVNSSIENTVTNLSAQNTNNPCDDVFQEEESKSDETIEDSKILRMEDTTEISSPVKGDFTSGMKSTESSLDYNQTENFSQLRYLLQSPSSKHSLENKIPLYSFPQFQSPNVIFDKQNSPLKPASQDGCNIDSETNLISNNDINFTSSNLSSKNDIDFVTSNLSPKNDINLTPSKQNFKSNESRDKTCATQENNQSSNTCLKFDVNQSRSEFSENVNYAKNVSTSNQKTQNCTEIEKNENFFKACPTPSTILDFSDLIQHSFENSSPSEDNLFSYSLLKQADLSLNVGMREEVRTPDCSDMMNYDSSEYNTSLKCQKCNILLLDHNDKQNHKCSSVTIEQSTDIDLFNQYKPKTAFYSLANIENQNKSISLDSVADKRRKTLSPEKPTNIFVCSVCTKVLSSETDLVRHQRTDHSQSFQNSSHTCECTKCHRTFPDIGELMKHSLTCLRTLFLKTAAVNDCLSSSDSLQALLKKEEPKTNFSTNSSSSFSTIPTEFSRQASESLLKRSFNS